MKIKSKIGFIINDLHRHPVAFYSIRLLTKLFKGSSLVRNDAPLSVLRGFTKQELQQLIANTEINKIEIKWKWAFRYLIIFKKILPQ